MLDIGLEIKILRERHRMSSKDLAARIGLSQSQMSRLEKGQRRIDTRILHKISEALGVDPSVFFRPRAEPAAGDVAGAAGIPAPPRAPAGPIEAAIRYEHLGKLVRSERRRRHFTIDELATKVGRTKAFMAALEEGRHALDSELADKLCRALRLPANHFLESQQAQVRALEAQVARLTQALAEAHRGRRDDDARADRDHASDPAGAAAGGVPLFGSFGGSPRLLFDADGQPGGDPEEFLWVPGFDGRGAFALHVAGDAMESSAPPSFREGDVVVFTPASVPRSRELALVRLSDDTLLFRQVFFEPDASVRLQPLNLGHAARTVPRRDAVGFWGLALHIARM